MVVVTQPWWGSSVEVEVFTGEQVLLLSSLPLWLAEAVAEGGEEPEGENKSRAVWLKSCMNT